MPEVFIPEVEQDSRLTEDWAPELEWVSRNLVLLKNMKYTGTKATHVYDQYVVDDKGNYVYENGRLKRESVTHNLTVPNPLYKTDDGDFVPVTVVFPKGLVFRLSKYGTGYKGAIYDVWLNVVETEDKRFSKRCVSVTPEQFNGAPLERV